MRFGTSFRLTGGHGGSTLALLLAGTALPIIPALWIDAAVWNDNLTWSDTA